jgi:hypothetical protein
MYRCKPSVGQNCSFTKFPQRSPNTLPHILHAPKGSGSRELRHDVDLDQRPGTTVHHQKVYLAVATERIKARMG